MASELDLLLEAMGIEALPVQKGARGRPNLQTRKALKAELTKGRAKVIDDMMIKRQIDEQLAQNVTNPLVRNKGSNLDELSRLANQRKPVPTSRSLVPSSRDMVASPSRGMATRALSPEVIDVVPSSVRTAQATPRTFQHAPQIKKPTMVAGNVTTPRQLPAPKTVAAADKAVKAAAKGKKGLFSRSTVGGLVKGFLGYTGGAEIGRRLGDFVADYTTDEEYKAIIKNIGEVGGGIAGSMVGMLPQGRAFKLLKLAVPAIGGLKLISGFFDDEEGEVSVEEAIKSLPKKSPSERDLIIRQIDNAIATIGQAGDRANAAAEQAEVGKQAAKQAALDYAAVLGKKKK